MRGLFYVRHNNIYFRGICMKKAFFIFSLSLFIILVFTIFYFKMHNNIRLPEELLVESFNSSGAHFINSEMCFEASLNEKCQNEKYLNKLMMELTYRLAIELNITNPESYLDIVENDYMYKLEINGETEHKENINICANFFKKDKDSIVPVITYTDNVDYNTSVDKKIQANINGEKYQEGIITLLVRGSEPYGRLQDIAKTVEDVFEKYKIKPEFSYLITGYFEGKLDHERMNGVCKSVFNTIEAEKIDGSSNKDVISVSAYSPSIDRHVEIDGNRANFNITFRYSIYDKKTYIWISTPVIYD